MPRVNDIQATPNPNAMKFVLDGSISDRPISFLKPEAAANHPLAQKLFAIAGVQTVLLLGDFVTINKAPTAQWSSIIAAVKDAIEGA